jgi:hypothetical protein
MALHSRFNGEVAEPGRVEVLGIGREGGGRRVLDALVDGEDRDVPGAAESSVAVQSVPRLRSTVGERSLRVKTSLM